MAAQKLQARPSAAAAASAGQAVSDFVDDADVRSARPFAGPAGGGTAPLEESPYVSSAFPLPFAVVSQTADAAAVRSLTGAAVSEPALSGNGFSYRHDWGRRRGPWTLRLNIAGATARSRVLVSAGEGVAGGPDAGKFVGAARFTVHNVAPRAGGVDVWIHIEWGADLPLYVDYLIVNP